MPQSHLGQLLHDIPRDDVVQDRLQEGVRHGQDQLQLVAVPDQDLGLLQSRRRDLEYNENHILLFNLKCNF